jgi:hypothetical protein
VAERLDQLVAPRVRQRDRDLQSPILGRHRGGVVDRLAEALRQRVAPADDAQADGHPCPASAGGERLERLGRDAGDRGHLVGRPLEVLEAERP